MSKSLLNLGPECIRRHAAATRGIVPGAAKVGVGQRLAFEVFDDEHAGARNVLGNPCASSGPGGQD